MACLLVAAASAPAFAREAALHAADNQAIGYGLSCPPDFLTETEQRMFAKDGAIRSGPWHVRCFQNGAAIYDRDHLYAFCRRDDVHAGLEGADGHAVRFQFPPDIACVWER